MSLRERVIRDSPLKEVGLDPFSLKRERMAVLNYAGMHHQSLAVFCTEGQCGSMFMYVRGGLECTDGFINC